MAAVLPAFKFGVQTGRRRQWPIRDVRGARRGRTRGGGCQGGTSTPPLSVVQLGPVPAAAANWTRPGKLNVPLSECAL
jgi:hypothetical protein